MSAFRLTPNQSHLSTLISKDKLTISEFSSIRRILKDVISELDDEVYEKVLGEMACDKRVEKTTDAHESDESGEMASQDAHGEDSSDSQEPITNQWQLLQRMAEQDPQCYNWCFGPEYYTELYLQIQKHMKRNNGRIKYKEIFWFLAKAPSTSVVRTCLHLLGRGKGLDLHVRRICSRDLSMIPVKRQDGVFALLHVGLAPFSASKKLDPDEESKRLDMITNRILDYSYLYNTAKATSNGAAVSSQDILRQHMSTICNQLVYIFKNIDVAKYPHIIIGATQVSGKLMMRHPELGKELLIDELLKPLLTFSYFKSDRQHHRTTESRHDDSIEQDSQSAESPSTTPKELISLPPQTEWTHNMLLVSEEELTSSINAIYKIYFGSIIHENIIQSIENAVPAFIHLFSFLQHSKLALRSQVLEILSRFFRMMHEKASHVLERFISYNPHRKDLKWSARFDFGSSGGVCIKLHRGESQKPRALADAVVLLLSQMDMDSLLGDFLVHLMSHFTSLKNEVELAETQHAHHHHGEQDHDHHSPPDVQSSLFILQTLTLLIEKLGDKIMNNVSHTLQVIKFLLLAHHNTQMPANVEFAQIGLSMLVAFLNESTVPLSVPEQALLKDVDSVLETYMQDAFARDNSKQIREFADCRAMIVSRIAANHSTEKDLSPDEIKAEINNALKELKDPLEAVQAHGLTKLRQLVLNRHPLVQKNVKNTLNIFKKRIHDEDDFVYYSAIRGLSAMGDIFPDEIIPLLCQEYRDKSKDVSFRVKVGEALILIMRRCGEILPKYATHFVRTFLDCCKETSESDPEAAAFIRSSSLSNIATAGEILRFGVHPFIVDIVDCIDYVIRRDPDAQTRRAAVLVIYRMLQGFGKQVYSVKDVDTARLRELLQIAQSSDANVGVRHFAESAENLMDELFYEYMRPSS